MGIFKRKKPDSVIPIEVPENPPHEHTWKDMPWYMEVDYSGSNKTASYKIIEPFICVTCGKRENKILENQSWSNIDAETREKIYEDVRKRYHKYMRPRAVVEDMINNILMVKDPEYLAMVEQMRGLPHKGCGSSSHMKDQEKRQKQKPKVPKIKEDENA